MYSTKYQKIYAEISSIPFSSGHFAPQILSYLVLQDLEEERKTIPKKEIEEFLEVRWFDLSESFELLAKNGFLIDFGNDVALSPTCLEES